jgi:DnaJ-class molecular chaperone
MFQKSQKSIHEQNVYKCQACSTETVTFGQESAPETCPTCQAAGPFSYLDRQEVTVTVEVKELPKIVTG